MLGSHCLESAYTSGVLQSSKKQIRKFKEILKSHTHSLNLFSQHPKPLLSPSLHPQCFLVLLLSMTLRRLPRPPPLTVAIIYRSNLHQLPLPNIITAASPRAHCPTYLIVQTDIDQPSSHFCLAFTCLFQYSPSSIAYFPTSYI